MSTRSAKSLRLIFEYDGDQIRLIKQQEVGMVPPPGDPLHGLAEGDGFWLEVRDAGMKVLHRQRVADPVAIYPEVFSDAPGKTIARSSEPVRKGAFTVVVPELPDSDHLAFMRAEPAAGLEAEKKRQTGRSGEIARFSIKTTR